MKKILMILGVGLILWGCVSVPADTSAWLPAPYVATFDYTAPAPAAVQENPAVFTVGKVAFKHAGKTPWLSKPQFANLDKAIEEDLPEILVAKGFGVRGPFDSYDLIPYGEKKTIDFYLLPVVTAMVSTPDPLYKSDMETATGPMAKVIVKIDLEAREIVTRELMWSKSLKFTESEVPVLSLIYGYQSEHGKITQLLFRAEVLENHMAKEVEKQYPAVMETIYKLIDPEEMTIIRKQAQEVRKNKGY